MKRVGTSMLAALAATMIAGAAVAQQGSDAEAFLAAIGEGDGNKVNELERKHGRTVLNYRGYSGETPLTLAMSRKNLTYVSFLLGRGADADFADKKGDTALIIAARTGLDEGVETMLSFGARVDAANRQGETALIVAVQTRRPTIVRKLLLAGANADKTDFAAGYSARDYARRDTRNRDLLKLVETVKPAGKTAAGPPRP